MHRTSRLTAIALTAAAVIVAGCGGEDPSPSATKPKAKPAGMTVQQYVTEVGGLGQVINDARSDYFHADHTRAAIKRGTAGVQAAYADAATEIATLDPPAAAKDLHRQLSAAWQLRAGQLEKLVTARRLDTGRIDDVMADAGHDVSTDELYTLPQ